MTLADGIGEVCKIGEAITKTESALAKASVALDTNALIAAAEKGRPILAGRAPVVSITAAKEFLVKGSSTVLRDFLVTNGGRIGRPVTETAAALLRQQASSLGRSLKVKDSIIAAGAIREGIPLLTQDGKLFRFMQAIDQAVELFK